MPKSQSVRLIDRAAIYQNLGNVKVGEGHDQREQCGYLMMLAIIGRLMYQTPAGAVDGHRLMELGRFQRRQA